MKRDPIAFITLLSVLDDDRVQQISTWLTTIAENEITRREQELARLQDEYAIVKKQLAARLAEIGKRKSEPAAGQIDTELLRKRDAATLLSMPVSTLEKLTSKKQIPHIKIGRSVRYSKVDLLKWVEGRKAN